MYHVRDFKFILGIGLPLATAISAPTLVSHFQFQQTMREESIDAGEFEPLIADSEQPFMAAFKGHMFYFCGAGCEENRIHPISDYPFHRRLEALLDNNIQFVGTPHMTGPFECDFENGQILINSTMNPEEVAYETWKHVMSMQVEDYQPNTKAGPDPLVLVNTF